MTDFSNGVISQAKTRELGLINKLLPEEISLKNGLHGIKICRISTVPFVMAIHLKTQVEYLRDIGMQLTLISSAGREWSRINSEVGLEIKIIDIPRSLSLWKDLIALIKLTRFLYAHDFDIIHSTTPKAGLLTALAALATCIPVRLHTFTGQPWITLSGIKRWTSRMADKMIGILNTKCYADSDSQARFLVEERIISHKNMSVIGNGSISGIDLMRFNADRWSLSEKQDFRQSLSIAETSQIIVFIGRITPDKGIVELISAFQQLIKIHYDVHLLLVGPQDNDCGGTSFLDLNGMGKNTRINYVGYSEYPEKYLAISDIFCLPSYREGFPTVALEAAAMGIPTVATKIYGITDAVIDGKTGILIPPRDEQALFKALKHLLDHPDAMHALGEEGKRRCIKYFNANIVNQKMAMEYLRLLKMKKMVKNT